MLAPLGCSSWEMVRPAEVPKLSGSFSSAVAQVGTHTAVVVPVTDVERPDGTLVQIRGGYDLRLALISGGYYEFNHPVSAVQEGDALVVRGANRAATQIPLADIQKAEVSQHSKWKTMYLSILLTIPLTLALPLIMKK